MRVMTGGVYFTVSAMPLTLAQGETMQTLREYVTEQNAATFLRPDCAATSADRASAALHDAILRLDTLRKHPRNADKGGACVRIRELMEKLTRVKDELDLAIEEAESRISVTQ